MTKRHWLLLILTVLVCASTACANAGTPLMWASMLHLAVGNALLGLVEGLLLAWAFKCAKRRSIPILIAANYASAWAGAYLVLDWLFSLPDITIQNIHAWFLIFVVVAFAVTLLIEFPFFWFALRAQAHALRRALIATPAVHGISYGLLFVWYWMASQTTIMTQLDVVSADELRLPHAYTLYFLSTNGDDVLRMDLSNPTMSQPILQVAAHHRNDRLFARPGSDAQFDLFLHLDSAPPGGQAEPRLLASFAEQAPIDWRVTEGHASNVEGSWFNFGPVPSLTQGATWCFYTGYWAAEGITAHDVKNRAQVRFSLEMPFAAWPARNATQLAGDYLLFQLGDNQICLLQPQSRKIALLARGKGPIVATAARPNKVAPATSEP